MNKTTQTATMIGEINKMNADELATLSASSDYLLKSTAFNTVFTAMAKLYKDSIMQTDPADTEAREIWYARHRALLDIQAGLTALAQNVTIKTINATREGAPT